MKRELAAFFLLGLFGMSAYSQNENIFTYRFGGIEVNVLVERKAEGRPGILVGADDAMIKRYLNNGKFDSQTNTVLVRTPDQTVLIDTGFGTTVFESMKILGVSPDEVDAVLITHMHGDHIGGLAKDGRALFSKAQVYISQEDMDFFTKTSINRTAVDAIAPYGPRIKTFRPGELGTRIAELLPGITPIAAFGHTPGHTVFLLDSEGKKFLVWGDLMHVMDIQFPLPDISVSYDTDPKTAAGSRRKFLDYTAKNNIPIAGMHLLRSSMGNVAADGAGYKFAPLGGRL